MERLTFGTATTSPPGFNLLRLEETLSAAHLRLSGAYIEKLDWQTCVTRYDRPHTFFHLDPPYWQIEGYGVPFEFGQDERMAAASRGLQGRAILTLMITQHFTICSQALTESELNWRIPLAVRPTPLCTES